MIAKFTPPIATGNLPETYAIFPITYRKHLRKHTDNLPETSPNTPLGTTYHTGSPAEGRGALPSNEVGQMLDRPTQEYAREGSPVVRAPGPFAELEQGLDA